MTSPAPAVSVTGVHKTFEVPEQHVMSIKERALHPVRRTPVHELRALREVSFEIQKGEFYGIVGRNGSGKSTLLKCLAGIYATDGGEIRIAGRVVPFIELGVGFNMEMSAFDNVVINGVMMGMTPREARGCFDEVIEFAELGHALDLKLKNYSSGMQVRLAFALMVQAESDVLLIDEVLAVGDAAFQQKCFDVFHDLREKGKTIILVTHDMDMIERFCHRALLLDGGVVDVEGEPASVARRYLDLNFSAGASERPASPDDMSSGATITYVAVENAGGGDGHSVAQGEPIHIRAVVEAQERISDPEMGITIHNDDGVVVFGTDTRLAGHTLEALEAGSRVELVLKVENTLKPGRYYVDCGVHEGTTRPAAFRWRAAEFLVYGARSQYGLVELEHTLDLHRGDRALPPAQAAR